MNRFSSAVALLFICSTNAFVLQPSRPQATVLSAIDRRRFAQVAVTGFVGIAGANPAMAAYEPKVNDLKQIYILGSIGLDRLIAKYENEDTVGAGVDWVRQFNLNPTFFPIYARNFISKTVATNADGDPRVGYIRQACTLIGSTQSLLEDSGFANEERIEAVQRLKKAQSLIAKFLAESGVEDKEVAAFVAAH